ncbi:MAG: hypothetical protein WBB42_17645 [Polyangiales bacterium]
MTRIFLTIVFAAAVAMGCDSTDTGFGGDGGAGGAGGVIGPLTWVASDLTVVGTDACEFFDPAEALSFEMTIDGSTVTMMDTATSLTVSTDNYFDTADEVLLTGSAENDNNDPCIVMLNDAMQLGLDNIDVSLDQNDTLSVTWDHDEAETSTDECPDVWFVALPCSGEATLTLTQSPAP